MKSLTAADFPTSTISASSSKKNTLGIRRILRSLRSFRSEISEKHKSAGSQQIIERVRISVLENGKDPKTQKHCGADHTKRHAEKSCGFSRAVKDL